MPRPASSVWRRGPPATSAPRWTRSREAVASLHAAGIVADELGATVVLANMWLARGRPVEARRLYERALAAAESHPGPVLSTTGDLHVGLADVLREQGDLDAAAQHLEVARELGDRAVAAGEPASLVHRDGRTGAGATATSTARSRCSTRRSRCYLPGYFPDVRPIAASRARVRIAQGRPRRRAGLGARARGRADGSADLPGRVRPAHPRPAARRRAVDRAPRRSTCSTACWTAPRAADRDGSLVEARLVRALAHQADGDAELGSGRPRTAPLPRGAGRLLPALPRRGTADGGAARAGRPRCGTRRTTPRPAAAGFAHADASAPAPVGRAVEEGLSERELEVLRLLATDLTGPEIARQLFLSVNTFRTHTRHIFTKLEREHPPGRRPARRPTAGLL